MVKLMYAGSPLNAILGTRKNSHYVKFALSETDPFKTNSLSHCDISFALVEFLSMNGT